MKKIIAFVEFRKEEEDLGLVVTESLKMMKNCKDPHQKLEHISRRIWSTVFLSWNAKFLLEVDS